MSDETRQQQNNDETIRALQRNESEVKALTESMRDLKHAVEEFIDRMDADIDTLREKSAGLAVAVAVVEDLKRRTTIVETKLELLGLESATLTAKLEAALVDRTKLETRLESLSVRVWLMSGAAGAVAWVAGKILR